MRSCLLISLLSLAFSSGPGFAEAINPRVNSCLNSPDEAARTQSVLSSLLTFPTIPYMIGDKDGKVAFLPTSEIFGSILGTPSQATILNQVEELRFLPNTLPHSAVLLVLNTADGLTEEMAIKALSDAKDLDLTISIVWISGEVIPSQLAKLSQGAKVISREELVRRVFAYSCPKKSEGSSVQALTAAVAK